MPFVVTMAEPGRVYLIGAGPWDPGLLTGAGAQALAAADVVFYDHLANPELIDRHCGSHVRRVFVGKRRNRHVAKQEEVLSWMIEAAQQGETVARLKGGDPFIFGRGGEELQGLMDADVSVEVIPGVTAAAAVSAYAGIPLTDRRCASSVAFVTGHAKLRSSPLDFEHLARGVDTVVFYMGVLQLRENLDALMAHGRPSDTPAAAISWASRATQRTIKATVADLAARVEAANLRPPALVIVGPTVGLQDGAGWFEQRPLHGRRVMVTRPEGRASEALASPLQALGAEVFRYPLIGTAPPADSAPIAEALEHLERADWLALTSRIAVRELAARIRDARSLGTLKVACVGPGTVDELWAQLRVRADLSPADQFDGAGLAQCLLREAPGRLLFPRAATASSVLKDTLAPAGWSVDDPVLYRTIPVETAGRGLVQLLELGEVDAITFCSGSAVHAASEILGADALCRLLSATVVACIGPRTAQIAEAAGLVVDVVAPEPGPQGLADALGAHFRSS